MKLFSNITVPDKTCENNYSDTSDYHWWKIPAKEFFLVKMYAATNQ